MIKGKRNSIGFGMAMGIIIGSAIGALTGNVGLWIVMGIAVGTAAGAVFAMKQSDL